MHLLGKLPFRKLGPLHLLAGSIRRPNIRPSRTPLRKPPALKSAADWFTAFERLLTSNLLGADLSCRELAGS